MAYFIASENLQGKYEDSGNTILIVKYDFEVDTESDLPAQNQFSSDGVKIAMTSTAHVIENNKKFEMQSDGTWSDITTSSGGGGGGATVYLTADNIAYDNTTSGLTADDVQEALDEIVSEMPTIPSTYDADDINYDNTTSGLSATNVQDALDEIVSDIPSIPSTYDADDIVYDNTSSGMTATNVQDAIDELNTDLSGKQDTLTFDNTPTQSSTNPVTSDGIYTALSGKQATLTFDNTPTQSSTNPVTSDGIYTALSGKQDTLTFDTTPTSSSTNPVTSGGVYTALSGKQDTLTFDTTPTQGSTNPVTSDGIYAAIQGGGGGGGSDNDTLHNGCFRGKFLGNTVTAEQLNAIYTGTFNDIYVGDYWTVNSVNWRVADIDYYYGTGGKTQEHHLILMPDTNLARMKASNASSVGQYQSTYFDTLIYTWLEAQKSTLTAGLGTPLNLNFPIAYTDVTTIKFKQLNTYLIPMAQSQVYAPYYYYKTNIAGGINCEDSVPFKIFIYYPNFQNGNDIYLRTSLTGSGSGSFSMRAGFRSIAAWPANNEFGIRPYYIMKGTASP